MPELQEKKSKSPLKTKKTKRKVAKQLSRKEMKRRVSEKTEKGVDPGLQMEGGDSDGQSLDLSLEEAKIATAKSNNSVRGNLNRHLTINNVKKRNFLIEIESKETEEFREDFVIVAVLCQTKEA